ncbi:hypothetical protein E4U61_005135 [Claviceps capensis]|nr:hypothetical protein E4U61_005135 [Claviceps capensis]
MSRQDLRVKKQQEITNSRSATADAVAADRNENFSPLKGAENYEEWEFSLDLHIQSLGLVDILTEDTPTTPANAKQQAAVTSAIWQSLTAHIQQNLT